ncbi:2Fe-2S iron-sulfur cluster-binding protein [Polymorphobacter fuscus]|uniref:2Fe-2S iron-sulfur cluster binding domain-containing protein n=1 Tax=Sandarakinorhabdus fusca TaxID=1439888 RepID=A0A7C9GTE6_9SPHN|nr:2Fe-2S iron-sulfur cluster-binding protein [Polymorphobacter fuscus]KAB7648836.1 2Fe-2S iron-sulfur cluster binding domain-containing protein [Polymorphobacter fuscus]MQT16418.1 2Fe-2S iron-sulfur cluster binding domain-containing protein [Polymorphobacter fuscus]NJC07292.1 ferredoxin [Polymorphobacter fuscus]
MTQIRFVSADGTHEATVTAAPGQQLLELAQAHGQPLEGTCEGAMACSTCHVLISGDDAGKLPPPSDEEEDMLDFAVGASRASRLACQIRLTPDIGSLTVRMPPGAVDMSRR